MLPLKGNGHLLAHKINYYKGSILFNTSHCCHYTFCCCCFLILDPNLKFRDSDYPVFTPQCRVDNRPELFLLGTYSYKENDGFTTYANVTHSCYDDTGTIKVWTTNMQTCVDMWLRHFFYRWARVLKIVSMKYPNMTGGHFQQISTTTLG